MTKKTIYIAGKISGELIHKVTMKFGAAQKKLEAQGYLAINPLIIVGDWHLSWNECMCICIRALIECEAIYLLPDWQESKGATLEAMIAKAMGMEVIHAEQKI